MNKLILLFTFLFTISSSFISCRDNAEATDEVVEEDFGTDEVYDNEVATNFGDYDLNDDNMLDRNEFGEAYQEDWTVWDLDGSRYLDDNEFYSTTFTRVDANDDNLVDQSEWNAGYTNLYGDFGAEEDFAEYDLNDDNVLDESEWNQGWTDSEWFNDYDANDDQMLDNNEWDEGIFGAWDENDDDFWDENEYNTYNTYYDTW